MEIFVYIIYSKSSDVYYKGISTDVNRRLEEHNLGKSRYTSGKGIWTLVYLELMADKRSALIREKQIKRLNRCSVESLLRQPQNLLLVK